MCGRQIEEGVVCSNCYKEIVKPFSIEDVVGLRKVWVLGNYTGKLKQLIQAFKFRQDMSAKRVLLYMLVKEYAEVVMGFDLLVPIPMEVSKIVLRGYNQSEVLARGLAKAVDVSVSCILSKRRGIKDQVGLSRDERWLNVKGAFMMKRGVSVSKVLLVDDILTTGATLSAAASVLRSSGVGEVSGIVLAR